MNQRDNFYKEREDTNYNKGFNKDYKRKDPYDQYQKPYYREERDSRTEQKDKYVSTPYKGAK